MNLQGITPTERSQTPSYIPYNSIFITFSNDKILHFDRLMVYQELGRVGKGTVVRDG